MLVEAAEAHQGLEGSQIRPVGGARKDFVVVEDYTSLVGHCALPPLDNARLSCYRSSHSSMLDRSCHNDRFAVAEMVKRLKDFLETVRTQSYWRANHHHIPGMGSSSLVLWHTP